MKGFRLWEVAALCVLSGSGWILTQAWPSEIGFPFASGIHFACIGCLAAMIALCRDVPRLPPTRVAAIGAAGVSLFVLPAMALHFAAGALSETSAVALFCAIPVMTILGVSFFGKDGGRSSGLLLPAVVALGGASLLFPIAMPGSVRECVVFGLVVGCCLIVAAGSVWMHRLLQRVRIAAAVAVVGLAGAVVLSVYGLKVGWPVLSARKILGELLRCVIFDLPMVWFTVWLMREVNPVRLTARFLLVPLVTLLEQYAAIHVRMDVKTLLEMAVVLVGSVMLLVRDEPEEIPGLHLR